MNTHKLLFALMACAMGTFASAFCEIGKYGSDSSNDQTDTVVAHSLPDYGGYVILGEDTMAIDHIVLVEHFGSKHNKSKSMNVYVKGDPCEGVSISFKNFEPSETPQDVSFSRIGCFANKGKIIVNDSVGIYTIEFDEPYHGKRLEIHYLGPISDATIPSGTGALVMGGDTANVYYNDCQFTGAEYNLFFNSHSLYTEGDYNCMRITIATPVVPGTYNLKGVEGFFPIIIHGVNYNGMDYSDLDENCVLTIGREGEVWTLHLTGTFQGDDFEFTYNGALIFDYLLE